MDPASLNIARELALFLQTSGPYAVASLALLGFVWKDRQARRSEQEKFELALSIAPLADRLGTMFEAAARASARARLRDPSHDSSPPPSSSGAKP